MNRIKKKQMLLNNPRFIKSCNTIRKYYNEDKNIWDGLPYNRLLDEVDKVILVFRVSQRTIIECISLPANYLGALREAMGRTLVNTSRTQSLLVDRLHYARLITEGVITPERVVKLTGACMSTIYTWVRDYKAYGNKMVNQAIAFKREL